MAVFVGGSRHGRAGVPGWLLPFVLSDRVVFPPGKGPLCPTALLLTFSLPCFVLTAVGIPGHPLQAVALQSLGGFDSHLPLIC